jgi:nucleoside-diphosphate-sugar epimerase
MRQEQSAGGLMGPELIVVTGAGGFIGGHMARHLAEQGARVRAVDTKPVEHWHQVVSTAQNLQLDLRRADACDRAVEGATLVYNFAADMGGMGFIEANKARCMLSVLINTHLLRSALRYGVERYFFASSACVYASHKQLTPDIPPLKEADAYPADPEDGYGWEKLFGERMCHNFHEDFGLVTRIARYHNVYGPKGTWHGGREKAPAAICRKVAQAQLSGRLEIEIWGDGEQTRSFMFIGDCIEGTRRIMDSDIDQPINLGSGEMVSINQVVDIVEDIAGVKLARRYVADAPKGVRGRNSDNTLIRQRLGWEPSTSLREGLAETYRWVFDQVFAQTVLKPSPRVAHRSRSATSHERSEQTETLNLGV